MYTNPSGLLHFVQMRPFAAPLMRVCLQDAEWAASCAISGQTGSDKRYRSDIIMPLCKPWPAVLLELKKDPEL